MSPRLARWILRMTGWQIEGDIPSEIRKYVVIAAPHTSWWDFPLGLLARAALGREIHFIGKKSLFRPPLGWFMRWLGGVPADRSISRNLVDQVVEIFNARDAFAIALAPEGTRAPVRQFRTGFYYIARGAGVPVICATLDYFHKTVTFSTPFYPTDDPAADLKSLWDHFRGVPGKVPEKGIF